MIECMDEKARMLPICGKYEGMDRYECRKAWVEDLDKAGYLVKTEDLIIPTGECYRCHSAVEPRISEQWFVKMKPLAEPAIEAVRKGETQFVPERFDKIYYHWMEDIKDWCISRQLWWGHRIPAYYCDDCGEMVVAKEMPEVCPKCGGKHFHQDEDVLDTWFSSALWPFSTLGWPKETEDLKKFYPTSVLVTGYDIIFFWVARMIFCGIEDMGKAPFAHVLIHGLVRDAQGRKMSKSLGNGIDPLEVIDQYGADALRFMLLSGIAPGSDIRYQTEKIEAARNFANKLWNASRFVIMNLQDEDGNFRPMADAKTAVLKPEDKWLRASIDAAVAEITDNMEKFEFALAAAKIYDLIWGSYCDWYIELAKPRLNGANEEDKLTVRYMLVSALLDLLKLLHPYMPFITEEIYSYLPKEEGAPGFLMTQTWPVPENNDYSGEVKLMESAMAVIRAIRNIRAEAEAAPSKKLHAYIIAEGENRELATAGAPYIEALGGIEQLIITSDRDQVRGDNKSAAVPGMEIYIPMDELVDYAKEKEKLTKEAAKLESEIARAKGKLANQGFVSKAPANVIEAERAKLAEFEDLLEKNRKMLETVNAKLK
jgi:valyl-tRNA synthetase